MTTFTAALVQMRSGQAPAANLDIAVKLIGEAKQTGPEFDALFQECMKQPQQPHTSGGGRK